MCWMDVAKRGIDELGAALDRWDAGDAHGVWAVSIIADTAPIVKSELKARTLHKRAQVVARFLKLQVENGNTRRLENQDKVGTELGVSPPLVASWTRTFLRTEPKDEDEWTPALPGAAAAAHPSTSFVSGGGASSGAPVYAEHQPLTFPPINPYTVPLVCWRAGRCGIQGAPMCD